MNKYKKPDFIEDDVGRNPFMDELVIRVNKVPFNNQYKKDVDGDLLPVEQDIEYDASCRVYTSSKLRKAVLSLPPRCKDLLLWLIYEADSGKDWLWLNKVRYMEESGITSMNTYRDALKGLMKEGFISRSLVKDVFFINPKYFFNGNRITKYPKKIKQI